MRPISDNRGKKAMTIWVIIDCGSEGLVLKAYDYAVDAQEEIEASDQIRSGWSSRIRHIIHGSVLTREQLHNLVIKEEKQ
jgi:hypothetical protein